MKKEAVKTKVIARLLNHGYNDSSVKLMIKKHFEYAFEHYSTVKTISEVISCLD
jgi:hypothetical protein